MAGTRMVPLTPVTSEFAGRVIVAKLGSAGILAELRGTSRVYPEVLGAPVVWVEAEEWADARELITADTDDELNAAEENMPNPLPAFRAAWRPVLVAVAALLLATLALGVRGCGPATPGGSVQTR